ncbi:hypothetical protein QUB37_07355 [Microcoleus sp. AT3-A2]|uniref:hypothetical protein n=1 Tax=Microcoleus sp. AT3-A2 TaxID=2818610 RepID=UPI002FD0C227
MEQQFDLQSQLAAAQAEIARLRENNEQMQSRIRAQTEMINRAKDINPVNRPSFKRVLALAQAACFDLCKCPGGGWFLSLGQRVRKFKSLTQIWDILCLDDWFLEDLFAEFLVVKSPNVSDIPRDFDWDNRCSGGILTQAQNSFEAWHSFAGAIPFSSE